MSGENVIIIIGGFLITALLSMVTFFLVRLVKQLDNLDEKLSKLETSLALYAQTVEYLKEQLEKIKEDYKTLLHEHAVLKNSMEAFDEWLYSLPAKRKKKPKPPKQP